MSFHENKYVIEKKSGHPGFQSYTIISTPEHMKELVEALSRGLSQAQPSGELWNEYATIARGETSRVYLSFAVTSDLKPYHKRPRISERIRGPLGCLIVLACLYFTWIGLLSTIQKLFK